MPAYMKVVGELAQTPTGKVRRPAGDALEQGAWESPVLRSRTTSARKS